MNYIRIVLCLLLTWVGWWITSDNAIKAFGSIPTIVEVPGVLNIWAGFCSIFAGLYLIAYSIKDEFKLSVPIGDINKVLIASTLVLAPLLTVGTYTQIHTNIESYVECSELRKFSSRYSSRTYATSTELCQQLSQDK